MDKFVKNTNKTLIVLVGKTCSGKSTIAEILRKEYGYVNIIRYTTRPKRKTEIQDIDYHFVTEEFFKDKIKENKMLNWEKYQTDFGEWYYGTSLEDLENMCNKSLIIVPPSAIQTFSTVNANIYIAYIYVNNATMKNRLTERGDNMNEAMRRIKADNCDFKGVENCTDRIFYNNDNDDVENVANKIADWIAKQMKAGDTDELHTNKPCVSKRIIK